MKIKSNIRNKQYREPNEEKAQYWACIFLNKPCSRCGNKFNRLVLTPEENAEYLALKNGQKIDLDFVNSYLAPKLPKELKCSRCGEQVIRQDSIMILNR